MLPLGKKTLPERDFCTKFITPEREKGTGERKRVVTDIDRL
jgi:hypothetical protein